MHRNISATLSAGIKDGTKKIRAKRTKKVKGMEGKRVDVRTVKAPCAKGRSRDVRSYMKKSAVEVAMNSSLDRASKVCWRRNGS